MKTDNSLKGVDSRQLKNYWNVHLFLCFELRFNAICDIMLKFYFSHFCSLGCESVMNYPQGQCNPITTPSKTCNCVKPIREQKDKEDMIFKPTYSSFVRAFVKTLKLGLHHK